MPDEVPPPGEASPPPVRRVPATPNRYALPWTSMVGAMLVVLGVIAAFVVWRAVNRDDAGVPVATVDYSGWLKSARTDGRLAGFAPDQMPAGWRATSATYNAGVDPHWHLGVLTEDARYVGVEESLASPADQVDQYVDENARRGKDVTIAGERWHTWTDAGGDYAVLRQLKAPQGKIPETLLVVGSAPPAQIRSYAASLHP